MEGPRQDASFSKFSVKNYSNLSIFRSIYICNRVGKQYQSYKQMVKSYQNVYKFCSAEHLEYFRNFLNGPHANMPCTIENEKENRMSFLDVHIIREDKTFTASAYHKPTFNGFYAHFGNFLPSTYTFGTVYTLAYKCF